MYSMNTRDRLVESTRELLWERGYTGTSPRAIQQHAGVGQGSMYHHFTGKPDLVLAALNRTAEELLAAARAELAGQEPALRRITAYLRRERDALRGCPIGRMAQDPEIVADPALLAPVADTLNQVRVLLAEVLRTSDEFAGLDPAATAATLVAVLQGGYVLARAAGSAEPFSAAVDGALALLDASARD